MKNRFPGVNPHLNSFLQQPDGGWESFHTDMITYLRSYLDRNLPAGYLAMSEKSLQVRVAGDEPHTARSRPDVAVYQQPRPVTPGVSSVTAAQPAAVMMIAETLDEEEYLTRVGIHRIEGNRAGQIVTGIEILSPGNKRGIELEKYRAKRWLMLQTGLRLVEVDFLHETPPFLTVLPSYPDGDSKAAPYLILVSDPRPSLDTGKTKFYSFGVLDAIPAVEIPLDSDDTVVVDFGAIYQQVFESWRLAEFVVDYAAEPDQFGRYQTADREKIRAFLKNLPE